MYTTSQKVKLVMAYAMLLTMALPGAHRYYLRQPGWWVFIVIIAIQVLSVQAGVIWPAILGFVIFFGYWIHDLVKIPSWVRGAS